MPVFTDEPPALALLGRDRNIETFDVRMDAQAQNNVVASTLSFSNKETVTRSSQVRDLGLAGEELLRPGSGEGVESAASRRSRGPPQQPGLRGHRLRAPGLLRGVLAPFHPVTVKLGTTATSGSYVIQRVVHRLGRSEYTQEFTLVADALSETAAGSDLVPAGLF